MDVYWKPMRNGHRSPTWPHLEPRIAAGVQPVPMPKADVIETKDTIIVELDLPGYELDDIEVKIDGLELTISAERPLDGRSDRTYHRSERPHGRLMRTFTLPKVVDPERVGATYRSGVLCVDLPKREEAKPRKIDVAGGE